MMKTRTMMVVVVLLFALGAIATLPGCNNAKAQQRIAELEDQLAQANVVLNRTVLEIEKVADGVETAQTVAQRLETELPQLVDSAFAMWPQDPQATAAIRAMVDRIVAQVGPVASGAQQGEQALRTLANAVTGAQGYIDNQVLPELQQTRADLQNAKDGWDTAIITAGGIAAALGVPGAGFIANLVGRRQGARDVAAPIAAARRRNERFDAMFTDDTTGVGPALKSRMDKRYLRKVLDEVNR
jgi:cell division septum initiation protein DivIVA